MVQADETDLVTKAPGWDEYPGRNKTIENTRMVPVILSIASQDDLLLRTETAAAIRLMPCSNEDEYPVIEPW